MPRLDCIPPELLCGPFTLEMAQAAGLTRHHLAGKRFRRVFRSAYVTADHPDTLELRCDAARLVLPGEACFSHETAVALFGLPLPTGNGGGEVARLHVTVPTGLAAPRADGITGHVRALGPEDVRVLRQRRLTTAARTFTDLAESYSRAELVVLGDAMLNQGWLDLAELEEAVIRNAGRPGSVLAAHVLPFLEPRSASPMESLLRLGLVDGGLPRPEVNVPVFDAGGQWIAQPDLLYRKQLVAIEYEGDHHRTDKRQFASDTVRDRLLVENGYVVLRFTAAHVLRDMYLVVDSVRHVLDTRAVLLGR